jgi:hypothetical protein
MDDWLRELGSPSRTTPPGDSCPQTMLIDIDLSTTTIDVLSDSENGVIVAFGRFANCSTFLDLLTFPPTCSDRFNAKRSLSEAAISFLTLSVEDLLPGRNLDRMFLSPTQLNIEVHDIGSHGRTIHITTGDSLAVSVCFDRLHLLFNSYSNLPVPKISHRGVLTSSESSTTVSCLIGCCMVTLSCKSELSTIVQVSAKQAQLRFDSGSKSLDFTIGSLGVLDLSGSHITKTTMLIRDREDTGDGGPNFSINAVLGTTTEMTIVLSRLCFAILPYRVKDIFNEFQAAMPTTKPNSSTREDGTFLNFRITCNQSRFIYSPERLHTRLGIAVGL